MPTRTSRALGAILILLLSAGLGYFIWNTHHPESRYAVRLGLDLAGGTELVYRADTSGILPENRQGALNSLRDVIDRRINAFGVAEPLIQTERSSAVAGEPEDRLLVELPGVTDLDAAVEAIGKTPVLEFKVQDGFVGVPQTVGTTTQLGLEPKLIATGLTGQYLKNAELQFGDGTGGTRPNEPIVVLNFNDEGARLFEQITRDNVGKQVAIVLDGEVISSPVVREAISGGSATITGESTPQEARTLVQNLNFGALPVPITLASSNTIGPTLGGIAYEAGLHASVIGFVLVSIFMIAWYRLPGLVATFALVIYVLVTIAFIKLIPITLTAAGIAGFILSIGLAVDANVLIFERMKEELKAGKGAQEAATIGFGRAWPAIRDGHLTMIISAIILFWVGTSLVKGFALVFGLGVITSLFSAVFVTRIFLRAILPEGTSPTWRLLLSSGFSTGKTTSE
jgi:preprotein translocase subunit SecD